MFVWAAFKMCLIFPNKTPNVRHEGSMEDNNCYVKELLTKVISVPLYRREKKTSVAFVKTSPFLLSGLQIHFAFFFSLGPSV